MRGIRIRVGADGEVVVTKPVRVSMLYVKMLVERRRDWILEKVAEMQKKPKKLLAHFSVKEFKENKERARVLVHEKLLVLNKMYGYDVGRVSIRNQKTRWGSCSGKKNLSFNYKIVFLPDVLQEYLIVHELCHLREMNHSKKFWDLVALQIPDHKTHRSQLKLY